jgi:hypothetical protein
MEWDILDLFGYIGAWWMGGRSGLAFLLCVTRL